LRTEKQVKNKGGQKKLVTGSEQPEDSCTREGERDKVEPKVFKIPLLSGGCSRGEHGVCIMQKQEKEKGGHPVLEKKPKGNATRNHRRPRYNNWVNTKKEPLTDAKLARGVEKKRTPKIIVLAKRKLMLQRMKCKNVERGRGGKG